MLLLWVKPNLTPSRAVPTFSFTWFFDATMMMACRWSWPRPKHAVKPRKHVSMAVVTSICNGVSNISILWKRRYKGYRLITFHGLKATRITSDAIKLSLSSLILLQFLRSILCVLVFLRLRTARMLIAYKFLVKAHQRLVCTCSMSPFSFARSVWASRNVTWKVYNS